MKKKIMLILTFVLLFNIPLVYAHEKYDDGWHIVPINTEENRGKTWDHQTEEWAYYENGKETVRYNKIIGAHRGWGEAPENSLAAIRKVKENNYFVFETDVRFTKDNVAVLAHDAKINAVARNNDLSTITEDVYIKDLNYSELKANYVFNIERVNHSSPTVIEGYDTNRITTFSDMLDYVKANKMHVSIELKEGTKEQIESLVQMANQKNMHNYVRWISFYTDLLKYVRDYDDDETLGVNQSSSCDDSHNTYCGEETDYFVNKLKTDKNILFIGNNPNKTPALSCAVNLPSNLEGNAQPDPIDTIPMGKITLSKSSTYLEIGDTTSITYTYDGDGTVKCVSADTTQVTCSIDTENKTISFASVGERESAVTVKIYATQGISHSATNDSLFTVTLANEETMAKLHVRSIDIKDHPISFRSTLTSYIVMIKDEDKLDLTVTVDDGYDYNIEGNENLKTGSIIKVNILKENKIVADYEIEVKKDEVVPIPDTFKSIPFVVTMISIFTIIVGIGIFGYQYLSVNKE